jgi:hypothetical protein
MGMIINQENAGTPAVQRELPKEGLRLAIITGIIDIGIQAQEYEGEKKPDCREFIPILALCNDKYTDEEGKKHNMVTSPYPIKIKLGDKSNYTKFCNAVDPRGEVLDEGVGDISELIGRPVFAKMVKTKPNAKGIVYCNCKAIQEVPEDYPLPEMNFVPFVFDCTNPDKKLWDTIWDSTKNKIKAGVEWDQIEAKLNEGADHPVSTDGGDRVNTGSEKAPF